MSSVSVSHIGLCVSDLQKSMTFYCEGLGFATGATFEVGNEFQKTLEVDGDVAVTSQFIAKDGFTIELLYYKSPGTHGEPNKSRNHLGITHLSLNVHSVDTVGAKLVALGGTLLEQTMTQFPNADGSTLKLVFYADPDGTRIELMENAAPIS